MDNLGSLTSVNLEEMKRLSLQKVQEARKAQSNAQLVAEAAEMAKELAKEKINEIKDQALAMANSMVSSVVQGVQQQVENTVLSLLEAGPKSPIMTILGIDDLLASIRVSISGMMTEVAQLQADTLLNSSKIAKMKEDLNNGLHVNEKLLKSFESKIEEAKEKINEVNDKIKSAKEDLKNLPKLAIEKFKQSNLYKEFKAEVKNIGTQMAILVRTIPKLGVMISTVATEGMGASGVNGGGPLVIAMPSITQIANTASRLAEQANALNAPISSILASVSKLGIDPRDIPIFPTIQGLVGILNTLTQFSL